MGTIIDSFHWLGKFPSFHTLLNNFNNTSLLLRPKVVFSFVWTENSFGFFEFLFKEEDFCLCPAFWEDDWFFFLFCYLCSPYPSALLNTSSASVEYSLYLLNSLLYHPSFSVLHLGQYYPHFTHLLFYIHFYFASDLQILIFEISSFFFFALLVSLCAISFPSLLTRAGIEQKWRSILLYIH